MVHFSELSWAENYGKWLGRTTADVSALLKNFDALNCEKSRAYGISEFGDLSHPVVENYAKMIIDAQNHYKRELDQGEILVTTKTDITSAFMQLSLSPEDVRKVCFSLEGEYVLIFLTAFFGHTYFPQAWGVVNRLLIRLCHCKDIKFVEGYVDDFSSATLKSKVESEKKSFKELAEGLLGCGCINEKKYEEEEAVIHIGWVFDLKGGPPGQSGRPVGTVGISRRYLSKVLFAMFNHNWILRRDQIEGLASHMIRISGVYRQFRPFTSILFNEIKGLNRNVVKPLETESINAILIWRAFLVSLYLYPEQFIRTLPQVILKKTYSTAKIRCFVRRTRNNAISLRGEPGRRMF
jgi:hypothetical protein